MIITLKVINLEKTNLNLGTSPEHNIEIVCTRT